MSSYFLLPKGLSDEIKQTTFPTSKSILEGWFIHDRLIEYSAAGDEMRDFKLNTSLCYLAILLKNFNFALFHLNSDLKFDSYVLGQLQTQ